MTNTATQLLPQLHLVRVEELLTGLRFVQCAQSREETRYYLRGVLFDKQAGKPLTLVATDGHRLHKITVGAASDTEFKMIVSSAAVKEVIKYLAASKKLIMHCVLSQNGDKLVVCLNGNDAARAYETVDGRFPDYARVIPNATEQALFSCYNAGYLADTFAAFDKLGAYRILANKADDCDMSPIVFKTNDDGFQEWDAVAVIMPMRV